MYLAKFYGICPSVINSIHVLESNLVLPKTLSTCVAINLFIDVSDSFLSGYVKNVDGAMHFIYSHKCNTNSVGDSSDINRVLFRA